MKMMLQEKTKSAKILALQRRFSSCSNLGKQSDMQESLLASARQESRMNGQFHDMKHMVNEKILSSSMSSSSAKAPHFVSQLYHPVEKNAHNNFESKLIHSSSVETPPPTAKFQTTRLRSGSCPQVWQPLKFSFPINIQTNSMNGSSNSLHSAGNENNNIAPNKNIKSDYFGYNQPQHPSTNNCPANSFSHNAQRFNKGVMDNNNNVKFRKPLNNNNNSKDYQNISHDNNSNIFRMNSAHSSPLLKKNEFNNKMAKYNYNQPVRQCHESVFHKNENVPMNYQMNKPQYNMQHNYAKNNSSGINSVASFYNKTNNFNKVISVNPAISSNDNILEMNISLNSKQTLNNNNNNNIKSSSSQHREDVHSSYEDLQDDDEFSTNEENYSSDLSPNPSRKSMYVNSSSNFTSFPNLKRTVSTDCFNNCATSNDILKKVNVVSSEHVISSPALKHGNVPLPGVIELQNSVRNSFLSNTDVYNLRSPSDVVKHPFNKSLSTSSASYQTPYSQSSINQFKPMGQSANSFSKNKNMNLTKTTSEQFLSCSQKNEKVMKDNAFNNASCLNGSLNNQKPLLNENASSKFVSSIFLNLSSTSLASKNPIQEIPPIHNSQHQQIPLHQHQHQQPQILHKQSSSASSSSPLLSPPPASSSSPKESNNNRQSLFRPSTLSLNKSNTAILNMGNNKANASYMNADNISNKTNLEQKNNNLYKRSNSVHNISNFQISKTPISPVCKKRQPTLSELQVFHAQKESFQKLLHCIKDMTKMRDKLKDEVKQLETALVRQRLEAITNRIKPTSLQELKRSNFILRSDIMRLSQHLQMNNTTNATNADNHKPNNVSHQFNVSNNITVLSPNLVIKKDKELIFQFPVNNSSSKSSNVFNTHNNNEDVDNDDIGDVVAEGDAYDNASGMYIKLNDKQRWSYNPSYNCKNC